MNIKLSELVKNVSLQESFFKTVLMTMPEFHSKLIAGKIINTRMFLYFNENILRKQISKNPAQYYYEYMNNIINKEYNNYRNLVRFEIKNLIENTIIEDSIDEVERMYLAEFHESLLMSYKISVKSNLNVDIDSTINEKEISDILNDLKEVDVSKDYYTKFLLGVIAHVNNTISVDSIDKVVLYNATPDRDREKILHKFNYFLDSVIGKHFVYDNNDYFIALILMAIQREPDIFFVIK